MTEIKSLSQGKRLAIQDPNEFAERYLALRRENQRLIDALMEAKNAMEHTLAMGHLTPGGSQQGWYKRLLPKIKEALGEK